MQKSIPWIFFNSKSHVERKKQKERQRRVKNDSEQKRKIKQRYHTTWMPVASHCSFFHPPLLSGGDYRISLLDVPLLYSPSHM